MSHRLTFFTSPTARAVFLFGCGCCVLVVFGFVCLVPVFCMCSRRPFGSQLRMHPDDRQLLHRSFGCAKKKNGINEMSMPKVLSEEDGVDVRERNVRVGRGKDVCNGFSHGIEEIIEDVASCKGSWAVGKAQSSNEKGMKATIEFREQSLEVEGEAGPGVSMRQVGKS